MSEEQVIVLDIGSSTVKAGLSGDDLPDVVFPTVCGKPKFHRQSSEVKGSYVGSSADAIRDILSLSYPVKDGLVRNFDDFEKVLEHTFQEKLKISPEDRTILLTEAPLVPKEHREKCSEILFETYHVSDLYLANQAVLSMIAAGRSTGVVLLSGEDLTMSVPVYQHCALNHGVCRLEVAGRHLTSYLEHLLKLRDIPMPKIEEIRHIKEKLCYVALDYEEEQTLPSAELEERYTGCDGINVILGEERFQCPELLFRPSLQGIRCQGVHEAIASSIFKCDDELEDDFYGNIVLSGGSTLFPDFLNRIRAELEDIEPEKDIKVYAPPARRYGPWLGGAILAGYPNFQGMCVSKSEYDEVGPSIVHRKCF